MTCTEWNQPGMYSPHSSCWQSASIYPRPTVLLRSTGRLRLTRIEHPWFRYFTDLTQFMKNWK